MSSRQHETENSLSDDPPQPEPWLPYGRHSVDEEDIDAVVEILRSDFLTTGPAVESFESAMMQLVGSPFAVAVNSGTAALHTLLHGFGVGPGDEVIVPTITFAATATAVLHAGAKPVFADVDPNTILLGPEQVESVLTEKTKAVIAVDFAGQACDYEALRELLGPKNIYLFADACHAIGGSRDGKKVGNLADATSFSFHPVKHVTTGEGGMVMTNSESAAKRMRQFRNHGISVTHADREKNGGWFYEIEEVGMNYRLSDIHCALGTSQLRRLDEWVARRQEVAKRYDELLANVPGIEPLATFGQVEHAYHLYVVRVKEQLAGFSRQQAFAKLRERQIGANVHYIPVHLHPYFQKNLGTGSGQLPNAESYYEEALTLPLFPSITDQQIESVVDVLSNIA